MHVKKKTLLSRYRKYLTFSEETAASKGKSCLISIYLYVPSMKGTCLQLPSWVDDILNVGCQVLNRFSYCRLLYLAQAA